MGVPKSIQARQASKFSAVPILLSDISQKRSFPKIFHRTTLNEFVPWFSYCVQFRDTANANVAQQKPPGSEPSLLTEDFSSATESLPCH